MRGEKLTDTVTLYNGEALEVLRTMPAGSVNCCVTSPPYYGLRRYIPEGSMQLRADLSEDERDEVIAELVRLGLIQETRG